MENLLNELFDELQAKAYNTEFHNYYYKEANQVIRSFFESNNLASGEARTVDNNECQKELCAYCASVPVSKFGNICGHCHSLRCT